MKSTGECGDLSAHHIIAILMIFAPYENHRIDNRSKMEKFFIKPIKLSIHLKSLKGVGSKVNPFNPLSLSVLSVTRAPRDTRHVTRAPRVLVAACVISDTVPRHEERHCSHGPINLQPAAAI